MLEVIAEIGQHLVDPNPQRVIGEIRHVIEQLVESCDQGVSHIFVKSGPAQDAPCTFVDHVPDNFLVGGDD